jgi:hypothetical protein
MNTLEQLILKEITESMNPKKYNKDKVVSFRVTKELRELLDKYVMQNSISYRTLFLELLEAGIKKQKEYAE